MDRPTLTVRQQLERIRSFDFDLKVSPSTTPANLRQAIRRTDEFAKLRESLTSGLLTENTVRAFVSELVEDFRPGKRFENETALATLAVLFESHFSRFAEEYLLDLARLKTSELAGAVRVARECLRHRVQMPRTDTRTYQVGPLFWPAGQSLREVTIR